MGTRLATFAGCVWPSFTRPLREGIIKEKPDHHHGMRRIEVRSKKAGSHLGHLLMTVRVRKKTANRRIHHTVSAPTRPTLLIFP